MTESHANIADADVDKDDVQSGTTVDATPRPYKRVESSPHLAPTLDHPAKNAAMAVLAQADFPFGPDDRVSVRINGSEVNFHVSTTQNIRTGNYQAAYGKLAALGCRVTPDDSSPAGFHTIDVIADASFLSTEDRTALEALQVRHSTSSVVAATYETGA